MRETINSGRTVNQKIEEIIEVHFSYCKIRILRNSSNLDLFSLIGTIFIGW